MLITVENSRCLSVKEIYVYPSLEVEGKGFIGLRSQLRSGRNAKASHIACFDASKIGSYSQLNDGAFKDCCIGNYCSIAECVRMFEPHDESELANSLGGLVKDSLIFKDFLGTNPSKPAPKTYIGSDVWIGSNVQIKAGVIIGHGAVIGAGTNVSQHVPPYAVVVGDVPRIMKWRFPKETVERMLNLRWFDYDWRKLFVHWGKLEQGLADMEQLIKDNQAPLIGDGFRYQVDSHKSLMIEKDHWSFSEQLEQDFGTSDMRELFARPEIQEQSLQFA